MNTLHQRSSNTMVGEVNSVVRDNDGEQPDAVPRVLNVGKHIGPEDNLRMGTWNVGSMSRRSGEIVDVMMRRKIELCCLQETRWKGGSAKWMGKAGSRFKFFWKGSDVAVGGIGIMMCESLAERVIRVDRVSDRLLLVKFVLNKRVVNVISAYAPQSGRPDIEKEAFWQRIHDLVADIPHSESILVGGDLNGHVGKSVDGYEGVHGGFGFGCRNEGGMDILDFATATSMSICNTYFKKPDNHLITYESGGRKTQIDFILTRNKERNVVKNVKVIAGEECVNQHRLIIADIFVRKGRKQRKKFIPKLKVWKLSDSNAQSKFEKKISDHANEVEKAESVESKWIAMKKAWLETSNEICGWTKGHPRHKETWWWNDAVANAVEEKRRRFRTWRSTNLKSDEELYRIAKRNARHTVWEAQQRKSEELSEELIAAQGSNRLFKAMKLIVKDHEDLETVTCVKNESNEIVTNEVAVKETWRKYMQSISNTENDWMQDVISEPIEGPSCYLSEEEYTIAVSECGRKKAAGTSGIVAELLKASGKLGIQWLANLGNAILHEGKIPSDWMISCLIPIYKGKGDPLQCSSHRGIKLLEHAMKVHERVIEKRIRAQVKMNEMQFGFMPGRGTTDAIFVIRQMQEKFLQKEKPLYFAFIDLEKAFDRIPREVVRWALRTAGVEEWLVEASMTMYHGAKTMVRTGMGNTETFEVNVGVHQGSVLSPLLFIIVMDAVARNTNSGLPWEIMYADDLVLLAESEHELKEKIRDWKNNFAKMGMVVNAMKSKVMVSKPGTAKPVTSRKFPCGVCTKGVGSNSVMCTSCNSWVHRRCSGIKGRLQNACATFVCRICQGTRNNHKTSGNATCMTVDGDNYEVVEKFCYLGDMLDAGGGSDTAVTARIRSAWKAFHTLAPFLTSRVPNEKMKGKVFRACIQSCLTYACETWPMKVESEQRMNTTEMRMIRRMCRVSLRDKCSNEDLRQRMGIEPASSVMRRSRLRWYGHVYRMKQDECVKRVLNFEVTGRRPRGRPKKTWDETLSTDRRLLGLKPEDALDRQFWRKIIRKPSPTQSMENGLKTRK